MLVLFVMPYLDVIRRSFLDGTGQRFVGMENYKTVVENTSFRLAAGNTVLFLSACVPLLLFLSLFIAIYLQRNRTVGNWLKSVFLLPMAMPVASIVMERAFYQKWIFKSFSVLVWCDGTELAEYKVCFWHSGIQLYLEKSGV